MNRHLKVLAVLNIAAGLFGLMIVGIVILSMTVGAFMSGEPFALLVTWSVAAFVSALVLVFAIPSLIAGIGLLQDRPWGRTAAFVAGTFNLFNPPAGTLLGIYTVWVMLASDRAAEPTLQTA